MASCPAIETVGIRRAPPSAGRLQDEQEQRQAAEGELGPDGPQEFPAARSRNVEVHVKASFRIGLSARDHGRRRARPPSARLIPVESDRGQNADEEERRDQDERREPLAPGDVGGRLVGATGRRPRSGGRRRPRRGAQPVDGRDDVPVRATTVRRGRIPRERRRSAARPRSWRTRAGRCWRTSRRRTAAASTGRLLREPAHLVHVKGVRAVVDAGREEEQEGDRQAVGHHEHDDAADPEHRAAAMPRNA
jgi:hypothetical protein